MVKYNVMVLLTMFLPKILFGMYLGSGECPQYELCPERKVYINQVKANNSQTKPICFFCDEKTMQTNKIISEDKESDVRVINNKSYYCPFDQVIHLVEMPITHKESPRDFSKKGIIAHADTLQNLSRQLHGSAVSQELVANFGKGAGQSVRHWHFHLLGFKNSPLSLPETIKFYKNPVIKTADEAFDAIQKQLAITKAVRQVLRIHATDCLCCNIINNPNNDEDNLVIDRFKHNILCLPHYPVLPVEVVVMPCEPVASISELSPEAFRENMILAMLLMPKLWEYAEKNVRTCEGCNLFTKSVGGKSEQANSHVYTVVTPRTVISATPGTLYGNSCKLDFSPLHLIDYLKNNVIKELREYLEERD